MSLQLNQFSACSMFDSCFEICSEPILLFQRDLGRHQSEVVEKTPHNSKALEKMSLKSIKSLKFVKSAKNLSQNATEPLSPRVSLKSIQSLRKNSGNSGEETSSFDAFRNPFQKMEKYSAAHNIYQAPTTRREPQIKVHFHFEPPVPPRHMDESHSRQLSEHHQLPCIQVHNQHDSLIDPSMTSSLIFGLPQLSVIKQEEKEDLKSTHVSGQRLMVRGSVMKPKSVVSMMSSKSDADSVLLERPLNMDKLRSLF